MFYYPGPREGDSSAGNTAMYGSEPGYPVHQFATMQWGLSKAIAAQGADAGQSAEVDAHFDALQLRRMPFPVWEMNLFPKIFMSSQILLLFGFVFSAATITRDIVGEKELKLKAALMMMGTSACPCPPFPSCPVPLPSPAHRAPVSVPVFCRGLTGCDRNPLGRVNVHLQGSSSSTTGLRGGSGA